MALFEALGELVGAALVASGPAFDIHLTSSHTANYRALTPWLKAQAGTSSAAVDAIVDALARDIWVSTETRGLAQNAIEHHALAVAELLIGYPPQQAVLNLAIERLQSGGQSTASEPFARRIAVDVFGRARAALGGRSTGLKDDVAMLLLDRVYAHILADAAAIEALRPIVTGFLTTHAVPSASGASAATRTTAATTVNDPPAQTALARDRQQSPQPSHASSVPFLSNLGERFGLTDAALKRILAILDAQGVSSQDIEERLATLCAWLGEVRAQLQKPSNEDPDTRKLKAKAAALLAEADFAGAADALKMLRRHIREGRRLIEARLADEVAAIRHQMIEEARATTRLAELAIASQQFGAAAELFGEASIALPTTEHDLHWRLGLQRADALYRAAEFTEDDHQLSEAIAAYSKSTHDIPETSQSGLGQATLGLANALALAGRREGMAGRLQDAAKTYRKAITILKREADPKSWAQARTQLGRTLSIQGEREQSMPTLREAAEAFRDALKEFQSAKWPADYIATHMELGNVLLSLEEGEGGTTLLTEAATSYRAVIAALKPEGNPDLWANAQMNLGLALLGLGEQQSSGEHLIGSVAAFRAALDATVRETSLKKWALIKLNLGNALASLGDRDRTSTTMLDEAVLTYTAALEGFDRNSEPLKWAITQMNLGTAYIRVGERGNKRRNWLSAAGALVAALEVFEAHGATTYADVTRQNLRRFHESWEGLIGAPAAQAPAPNQARARLPKAG